MRFPFHNRTVSFKDIFFSSGSWALMCFFFMVFILGLIKIYSPDIGFHLRSAQWIIDHKQFIHTDSFSYGSEGNQYFDLQWLYQLLIYSLYNRGEAVLVVANALMITFSMVLAYYRFSKYPLTFAPVMSAVFFAFIGLLFVQPLTFEIRPHVLSWIFLNLVLLCLESYKRGNKNSLYLLPLVMLLWANAHSLAILGLAIIAIYNAGNYLEKKQTDKKLLLFSALSLLVLLITPYFIEGFLYPFKQFGIISGNSLMKSYIGEFQSPFTLKEMQMLGSKYFISPLMLLHLSALLCIFSMIRSVIVKQYTDTLLLAVFLVLLHLANKNYGYYLVVSLPLVVKHSLFWLELRMKKRNPEKTVPADKRKSFIKEGQHLNSVPGINQKLYKRVSFATIAAALLISITSISNGYPIFRHSPHRFGITTDGDQLPVEAAGFLNSNHIKGRLLNHLDFGGYLMAHYGEKVFIDGRLELIEEDFFDKYHQSLTVKNGIRKLLDEYNPEVVVFPYMKATYWWDYFVSKKMQSGYKAVYFDGLSVIYLKSSAFPKIPELTEREILTFVDPAAAGRITQSIKVSKPKGLAVLINGIWKRQSFSIADQNRATYCFANGFDTAALGYSVAGIENSTVHMPNIYKNLSVFFSGKHMYSDAQLCEDKSE